MALRIPINSTYILCLMFLFTICQNIVVAGSSISKVRFIAPSEINEFKYFKKKGGEIIIPKTSVKMSYSSESHFLWSPDGAKLAFIFDAKSDPVLHKYAISDSSIGLAVIEYPSLKIKVAKVDEKLSLLINKTAWASNDELIFVGKKKCMAGSDAYFPCQYFLINTIDGSVKYVTPSNVKVDGDKSAYTDDNDFYFYPKMKVISFSYSNSQASGGDSGWLSYKFNSNEIVLDIPRLSKDAVFGHDKGVVTRFGFIDYYDFSLHSVPNNMWFGGTSKNGISATVSKDKNGSLALIFHKHKRLKGIWSNDGIYVGDMIPVWNKAGAYGGAKDFKAIATINSTENYLYINITVKDDDVQQNGADIHESDHVEVWLYVEPEKLHIYSEHADSYATNPNFFGVMHFSVFPSDDKPKLLDKSKYEYIQEAINVELDTSLKGITHKYNKTKNGYTLSIKIPETALIFTRNSIQPGYSSHVKVMIDAIDVDATEGQSALASTSWNRKWGNPKTFIDRAKKFSGVLENSEITSNAWKEPNEKSYLLNVKSKQRWHRVALIYGEKPIYIELSSLGGVSDYFKDTGNYGDKYFIALSGKFKKTNMLNKANVFKQKINKSGYNCGPGDFLGYQDIESKIGRLRFWRYSCWGGGGPTYTSVFVTRSVGAEKEELIADSISEQTISSVSKSLKPGLYIGNVIGDEMLEILSVSPNNKITWMYEYDNKIGAFVERRFFRSEELVDFIESMESGCADSFFQKKSLRNSKRAKKAKKIIEFNDSGK